MQTSNYIGKAIGYRMLIVRLGLGYLQKGILIILLMSVLPKYEAMANDVYKNENEDAAFLYDEIPVLVRVEGLNSFYLDVIYTNDDLLYVNIEDLFRNLNIPCNVGQKGDIISGFIENESHTYSIDYLKQQIKVGVKTINTQKRIMKEIESIYIESSLFAEAFGITLTFNYRSLTMMLKSDFELPIIKQQFTEKLRNNMSKIKGEIPADTIVGRNYHFFKFGMIDWAMASTQPLKGLTDNRLSLSVGAELLYGEADISLNYSNLYKVDSRQLNFLWRWVDNNISFIKQAQLGKISNQTISYINSPVIGAIIRNSPTSVRKATGFYTINEFTEPNWTVELYINNVMVDFTKADASGLYLFKVPIVYGYTTLKLKFYGPLGEERIEERTMNIPYTVMPSKEFEYGLSAGLVQDSSRSRFARADFNYGINRFLTLGGGVEYLSSITNGAFIPFAKATFHPFSKLIFNIEYAYDVKTKCLFDYYFKKDVLLEIDYTKYKNGQLATRFNALEERKAKLSIPFRVKKVAGFAKLDYGQFVYNTFIFNQANVLVSLYHKQLSINSTTLFNWIDHTTPFITSNLALSFRLKKGFTIRPSVQYNIRNNAFMMYKLAIEKNIPKGYITATYERNILSNDHFLSLNFKYDFSFARTNISATYSKGNFAFSESAQGSLAFGSGNKYIHASNNSSVSKGGISLYPFLDLNRNGIFDSDEHFVKLTSVRVMGSRAIYSNKDSIVRIADLNAFTKYMIVFEDNDLENIAWRFVDKRYEVLIDPNQFKRVDIPIVSIGEVSGMIYIDNNNLIKGIGRISIKFYRKNENKVIAETLSESDGYFNYMGLIPGEYIARIEPRQLESLKMVSIPEVIPFSISKSVEGDIVDGLVFTIKYFKVKIKDIENNYIPVEPAIAAIRKPAIIDTNSSVPNQKPDQESVDSTISSGLSEKQSDITSKNITPNNPLEVAKNQPAIEEKDSTGKVAEKSSTSVVEDIVGGIASSIKLVKEKVIDIANNFNSIGSASAASESLPADAKGLPEQIPDNSPQLTDKESVDNIENIPGTTDKLANDSTINDVSLESGATASASQPITEKKSPGLIAEKPQVNHPESIDNKDITTIKPPQVIDNENNLAPTESAKTTSLPKIEEGKNIPAAKNYQDGIKTPEGNVQIGAFRIKSNAMNAQKDMMAHTNKQVSISYENGLYKVRIEGSPEKENRDTPIGMGEQPISNKPVNRDSENSNSPIKMTNNQTYSSAIQTGAFVKQSNAIGVEQKLRLKIDYPVNVLLEDGFYKVRISGFQNRKQAVAFLPKLFEMEFIKAYVVNVQQQ